MHTYMYEVLIRKNEVVVTGISEFIGTAKVPTSEVRTAYMYNFVVNLYVAFNCLPFTSSLTFRHHASYI